MPINLANSYHAKAKNIGRLGQSDPGEFPDEVKECLEKARDFYGYKKNSNAN
jgi:G-protein signaling modulator 2